MTWQAVAACRNRPDVAWFPPMSDTGGRPPGPSFDPAPALAVCRECPSLTQCRAWAERNGDIIDGTGTHGVVGGCAPPRQARTRHIATCLGCGRAYLPRQANQRYCTAACVRDARLESRRASRERLRRVG